MLVVIGLTDLPRFGGTDSTVSPKIRRHFRNKIRSILKLSKNAFYKKCGLKLIFFNEILFRKIQTFFDIEK